MAELMQTTAQNGPQRQGDIPHAISLLKTEMEALEEQLVSLVMILGPALAPEASSQDQAVGEPLSKPQSYHGVELAAIKGRMEAATWTVLDLCARVQT